MLDRIVTAAYVENTLTEHARRGYRDRSTLYKANTVKQAPAPGFSRSKPQRQRFHGHHQLSA